MSKNLHCEIIEPFELFLLNYIETSSESSYKIQKVIIFYLFFYFYLVLARF